jgi:ribosomal protein L22
MTPEQKESIYLRQKIDCNCNDCAYLQRDIDLKNKWVEKHRIWSIQSYVRSKERLVAKAKKKIEKGKVDEARAILREVRKVRYQFSKKPLSLQYGNCLKTGEAINFIPNTCQLDTQECFVHRKG